MILYLPLRAVARAIQTMSVSWPKSTAAKRHLRALLTLLCLMCCALPSWAGREVRVYEVDIEGQTPAALQDAMREALNSLAIDGTVVIGEGERDEAPMLQGVRAVSVAERRQQRNLLDVDAPEDERQRQQHQTC